jgi:hypothetical protein
MSRERLAHKGVGFLFLDHLNKGAKNLTSAFPVEGAVLDGFGNVFCGDGFCAVEIGDSA